MEQEYQRQPLEQWQQYNPLDKKENETKYDKSNKYPYCKPEKVTTVEDMVKPKVSVVGIVPVRSTTEVEDVGVMVVGKSTSDVTFDRKEEDELRVDFEKEIETENLETHKKKKKREKMPAIVASVGTTGKISFSTRKKPKPTPMTRLKGHTFSKPPLIPVPPNSRMSKRTSSLHSTVHDVTRSPSHDTGKTSRAPPSSPVHDEMQKVENRETVSARSVDEIIKSLRTSREGGIDIKSSADLRIDELLQQVLGHSEEWSKKDEEKPKKRDGEDEQKLAPDLEKPSIAEAEEDIDISDTVSTLASQISAPAGIPDVSAILLRKSSEAMNRGGSDHSEFSSPIFGVGDADDYVDAAQALKDLNQTLDVKNEDIIHIKGKPPPIGKIEPPSEDEGYYDGITSGPDSERFHPADLHTTVSTGGRIHHLCLLAANTATRFNVDPETAALTRLLHATGNKRNALHTIDKFTTKRSLIFPPAPPPSQAPTSVVDDETSVSGSQYDTPWSPPVLDQLDDYYKAVEAITFPKKPKVEDKLQETNFDTSNIDPLDIDAWRKIADNVIENVDMTQQGQRLVGKESNMWRLIWDPAPPKMHIPPVAVKATLFPKYHGAQLYSGASTGVGLDTDLDGIETGSENDEESKQHEFNLVYLNRRHKSQEDLSQLSKKRSSLYCAEFTSLQRTNSVPDLQQIESSDESTIKMKNDYSTAMAELNQQRAQAMEKEQEITQMQSTAMIETTAVGRSTSKLRLQSPVVSPVTKKPILPTKPGLPEQKLSEAELSRLGGQEYVPYQRKSRKKRARKNRAIVQEVRKFLSSYDPTPLKRSKSVETGLPDIDDEELRFIRATRPDQATLSRDSSRSLPKGINFQEFIDRYDDPEIDDMREWVRDIWNEWFDEVIPPSVSDEDSWSSVTSDHDDDEMAADEIPVKGEQDNKMKKTKLQ